MSDDKVVSLFCVNSHYKRYEEERSKVTDLYPSTIQNFKIFLYKNLRIIDLTHDCVFFFFYISFYRLQFKKIPNFLDKECVETNIYLYLKSVCIKDRLSIDILDYFMLTDVYCITNKKDDDKEYQAYAVSLDDYTVNDSADICDVLLKVSEAL